MGGESRELRFSAIDEPANRKSEFPDIAAQFRDNKAASSFSRLPSPVFPL